MHTFNHVRPVRDRAGQVVGHRPAPVFRVTVGQLGGMYCRDRRRRLVVGLEAGDVVSFRPAGTRQRVVALAVDLYGAVLRWQRNFVLLERARRRKARLGELRARRRLAAAERRLAR